VVIPVVQHDWDLHCRSLLLTVCEENANLPVIGRRGQERAMYPRMRVRGLESTFDGLQYVEVAQAGEPQGIGGRLELAGRPTALLVGFGGGL
jgi:hypothetical protein